jgi:putative NIF3 family GTP cyclohydrolase 1 type 2
MELNRRQFLINSTKAAGAVMLFSGFKTQTTVGEVMDLFIKEIPEGPFKETVDTLKTGSRSTVVTGIVTTMFATIDIIKKAIELKANFIITHETTFYNHQDKTDWLKDDEVYEFKAALLKKHNIAIWRNHDYIHTLKPDGVRLGVAEKLGWLAYEEPNQVIFNLPESTSLKQLIAGFKTKLEIPAVRYIGNMDLSCKKVLLMVGAAGGMRQISAIGEYKPDVIVCGEIAEWETAEYVRDAIATGKKLGLIVLGHIPSEEPGSVFMAKWLKDKLPAIKTTFLPCGNSLSTI